VVLNIGDLSQRHADCCVQLCLRNAAAYPHCADESEALALAFQNRFRRRAPVPTECARLLTGNPEPTWHNIPLQAATGASRSSLAEQAAQRARALEYDRLQAVVPVNGFTGPDGAEASGRR